MGKGLHYNFAAGSFHTKKLCSKLYSTESEFYSLKKKQKKIALCGRLRGNIHNPSIARWKACGRLPIRHNWTFFTISYSSEVISRNVEVVVSRRGGSVWAHISDGRGRHPPTIVGVRKLEWLPFHVVWKYLQYSVCFCHKAQTWQTDGQTDRITTPKTMLA